MKRLLVFLLISNKLFCQIAVSPSSTIVCNQNYSTANFTLSAGTPPYSFTVQTPTCTNNYTASSNNANVSYTLPCAGVYTFNVNDALNSNIGTVTHTVTLSTQINLINGINAIDDTICLGDALFLLVPDTETYTLTNCSWSNGATGYQTTVSPAITTTYSFSALYTSIYSKTCTAISYKQIVVGFGPCFPFGINTNNISNLISLFPNPFKDKLTLNTSSNELKKLVITNTLGQIVYTREFYQNDLTFDLPQLIGGAYLAQVYINGKFNYGSKLIKQ